MPLCVSRSCGCSITSSGLTITGDGSAANPWAIEGAAPGIGTRAARLALTGAALFEGRMWWETDKRMLWEYSVVSARWVLLASDLTFLGYGTQRFQGTVDGRLAIVGNSSVGITDSAGSLTVTFPLTFLSAPLVVAMGGDQAFPMRADMSVTPTTTNFRFVARDHLGTAYLNSAVRVNWIAIGMVAT